MIVQNYKQTMLLLLLYMYTIPLSGIDTTILKVPYRDPKTLRIGFFTPLFKSPAMMPIGFYQTAGAVATGIEHVLEKSENLTDYNFT